MFHGARSAQFWSTATGPGPARPDEKRRRYEEGRRHEEGRHEQGQHGERQQVQEKDEERQHEERRQHEARRHVKGYPQELVPPLTPHMPGRLTWFWPLGPSRFTACNFLPVEIRLRITCASKRFIHATVAGSIALANS